MKIAKPYSTNVRAFHAFAQCIRVASACKIEPERILTTSSGYFTLMYFGGPIRPGGARAYCAIVECDKDGDIFISLMDRSREGNDHVLEIGRDSSLEEGFYRIRDYCNHGQQPHGH